MSASVAAFRQEIAQKAAEYLLDPSKLHFITGYSVLDYSSINEKIEKNEFEGRIISLIILSLCEIAYGLLLTKNTD